jgi:hypothetical protein
VYFGEEKPPDGSPGSSEFRQMAKRAWAASAFSTSIPTSAAAGPIRQTQTETPLDRALLINWWTLAV